MDEFETMTLLGSNLREFFAAYNALVPKLPMEIRRRLADIQKSYFARYGFDGTYERMNNRTLAQIFSEFKPVELKPIASGEEDGVKYALFDPPSPSTDPEQK